MPVNFNNLLKKMKMESLCVVVSYFLGFFVIFYVLNRYFKPNKKQYLMAVYVLGGLVLLFLVFVFFRNLYYMKKSRTVSEEFTNKTITFYHMNGCGHCKNMKAEWEKLSENPPKGVSVKDIESKDSKRTDIRGFPHIELQVGDNKPKVFRGERTADAFRKFCNEN